MDYVLHERKMNGGKMSSGKKIKNPNGVKDDTHQDFHTDKKLSWCRMLFGQYSAPWDMPSKTRQGTVPAVPEADIFACVDLEFRSKASLQVCTP